MVDVQRRLGIGICLLGLCLLFGCGLVATQPTAVVMTREVTRVVTATPTITPQVVTITVVVIATPTKEQPTPRTTLRPAFPSATPVDQITGGANTSTPFPDLASKTTVPGIITTDSLDDPAAYLAALAAAARTLQAQGLHTLRLTFDLSVPIDVVIRDEAGVDAALTKVARNALSDYTIYGNYILDFSLDDLAQARWVIDGIGGIAGLETENTSEWKQNGDQIWEKPSSGEWSTRALSSEEALLPLGNSQVAIDGRGHALNISELLVDVLRPLAMTSVGISSLPEMGWTTAGDSSPAGDDRIRIERKRALSSSGNLEAIVASLADSEVSRYLDTASLAEGTKQTICHEEAWWLAQPLRPEHGTVQIQGEGTGEFSYLVQRKLAYMTVIINTTSKFEHLALGTRVIDGDSD